MANYYNNNHNATPPPPQKSPLTIIIISATVAVVLIVSSFITAYLLGGSSANANGLTQLPAPIVQIDINADTISWNQINGVKSYSVYINSYEHKNIKSLSVPLNATIESTPEENRKGDTVSIRVKSISKDGKHNSYYSNSVYKSVNDIANNQLSAPQPIKDSSRIYWQPIIGANQYVIDYSYNDVSQTITQVDTQIDLSQYAQQQGSHQFAIQAVDTTNTLKPSTQSKIIYTVSDATAQQLDTPINLQATDTTTSIQTLSWSGVLNATSYYVVVTDKQNPNDKTTYQPDENFTPANLKNGNYSFVVTAIPSDYQKYSESEQSLPKDFSVSIPQNQQLGTPTATVISNNLSWGKINDAQSYTIELDGVVVAQNITTTTYSLSNLTDTNKTYALRIKAIAATNSNYIDSDWSNIAYYTPSSGGGQITGDTSPAAVESRIKSLMPREAYEQMFPSRFGTDNWKKVNFWAYTAEEIANASDYYSYDNLINAAKLLAGKILKLQYRDNGQGQPQGYTVQTVVVDKVTQEEYVVAPGDDFDESWNINRPIIEKTVDMGTFMLAADPNDSKRDLAAFLANKAHETGGGELHSFNGLGTVETGLFFNEEKEFVGWDKDPENPSLGYLESTNPSFQAYPGQSYHGRGAAQLSFPYNYGPASGILLGDKDILLKNPDLVLDMEELGVATALFFWLYPQEPKASCSDVMTKKYQLTQADIDRNYQLGFGLTIIIFNGGLEADQSEESDDIVPPDLQNTVTRRIKFYRRFTSIWGVNISGEKLDTSGMGAWA